MKNSLELIENVENANNENKEQAIEKLVINFTSEVLGFNKEWKEATKSLGQVRSMILDFSASERTRAKLNPCIEKVLFDSLGKQAQNKRIYEFLKANVYHHPKSGKTGVFYVIRSVSGLLTKKDKFAELLSQYTNSEDAKSIFVKLNQNNAQ
jgi:hypothetical protein